MQQSEKIKILDAIESGAVKITIGDEYANSGIILRKEGPYVLILTCGHALMFTLEYDIPFSVSFSNGIVSQNFRVVSRVEEAVREISLVFGCDERLKDFNYHMFSRFSNVKPFSKVFCASYPYGSDKPFTVCGRVAQISMKSKVSSRAFAYDLSLAKGSSGAAIINDKQQIVGVHCRGLRSPVYGNRRRRKTGQEEEDVEEDEEEQENGVEDEDEQEHGVEDEDEQENGVEDEDEQEHGDDEEEEEEIGHGEGIVKFGVPFSHIKLVLAEFDEYLHEDPYYCPFGRKGKKCLLFSHFVREDKKRKKQEEKTKKRKRGGD